MKVELIEKYLEDKYNSLSITKIQNGYKLDGLFIYETPKKKLSWYVDVESDLYSWFGPGNYYEIIHSWFIKTFGKEIRYDK